MSTPSDFFAPDHEPRPEQSPEQQRRTPAPQENQRPPSSPTAADTGPQRRLPQPQHSADERRSATAPPAGPAPQHAGRPPRPHQPYQPSSQPHPNAAAPNAATGWQPSSQEPDDNTAMLSQPDAASGWDPSVGGFFTDPPAAQEHSPQQGRPASHPPRNPQRPVSSPQALFGGPLGDGAAPFGPGGGYGPGTEHERVVSSRRRPAGKGWRKVVSKMTFGLITPGPSAAQVQAEELIRRIRSSLVDVYVVAFVNAKGGVGKTTMTVAAGSAIARERGDRVIAVDVDTDLGNLSSRFHEHGGPRANIEALSSLQNAGSYSSVRIFTVQNDDRLELLAAQNDPRSSYTLNSQDFESAMKILKMHYNVVLLDCGTSITSPLFATIAKQVDSLVVVAPQDAPGLNGAWSTLSWLQAHGFGRLLPRTVVALDATAKGKPMVDLDEVEATFREQISDVIRVPYDAHLAEGGGIDFATLNKRTRKALMNLAGAVAQHYPARQPHRVRSDEPGRF